MMSNLKIITTDVAVVGTGAAGYNAAVRLAQEGKKKVLLITEGILSGTSRNTGSDKQTYYKLGLGGDGPDSVRKMAEDLFAGGSVDGDNALCEAALSARSFFHLCELGVPFPVNRYGEYIGYKTDHDPYARATSAGPLTSKFMTESLERKAKELRIPLLDGCLAVEILKNDGGVCGLLCLEKSTDVYISVHCSEVILATGGPAGIYEDSVYPIGHTGSSGLAVAAGAAMQNLTEWQYGLASVSPRWNVSGTYMQVLPRFISVGESGDEREFLADYFADPYEALSAVFLKGYQWPFDSRKVLEGSSVIDLLVYRECVLKKRRVYLDYRKNPFGLEHIEFLKLSGEAYSYLDKAGACFGTPIERLKKMNQPAIDLYMSKGRNLEQEPLEIALCAQHHNGGIAVDAWWQTTIPGLFAVGECAGTHGVSRPGGSALNAGQAGSLRAAQYCSVSKRRLSDRAEFEKLVQKHQEEHLGFGVGISEEALEGQIVNARRRMSDCGAAIRDCSAMRKALKEVGKEIAALNKGNAEHAERKDRQSEEPKHSTPEGLCLAYRLKDLLLMQSAVLTAMIDFSEKAGITRGSALYTDENGLLREGLEEIFRFCPENTKELAGACCISNTRQSVQQLYLDENGSFQITWRPVRPIPETAEIFETVWRQYRENKNIY